MALKLNSSIILLFFFAGCFAQDEGAKPQKAQNYKSDSSYQNFYDTHAKVAKAQINALKHGALLVRLKTNYTAIERLKQNGSVDLATQVERETFETNKIIVRAFTNEFKFCPVYFFYSNYSDSVKHKKTERIFLDTNLMVDPTLVCQASFYLVAEQGSIVNSSLGVVPESLADKAQEKGDAVKEVAVVIKNRYFIQLHKPFPYFQKGYKLKSYRSYILKFNMVLEAFYEKNKGYLIPEQLKDYIY